MSEEQKSKKESKEKKEVKRTKEESKVLKQSVYAFKPKGIIQRLSIPDENGIVRLNKNDSIALTEEKINKIKDLQLLIASGELEKVTN